MERLAFESRFPRPALGHVPGDPLDDRHATVVVDAPCREFKRELAPVAGRDLDIGDDTVGGFERSQEVDLRLRVSGRVQQAGDGSADDLLAPVAGHALPGAVQGRDDSI